MGTLILLRHGESQWNLENRFTGWIDVPLSPKGEQEAKQAGLKLKPYRFDLAFTSALRRAQDTLTLALREQGQTDVPVTKHEALNERHYGDLQGLNKAETAQKYGEQQVKIWRRSYDVKPPGQGAESLKETAERVLPYYQSQIEPHVRAGKTVLIAAHGNSLRALVKHLDGISDQDIVELNIPTGIPLLYELDDNLSPIRHRYLGDPEAAYQAFETTLRAIEEHASANDPLRIELLSIAGDEHLARGELLAAQGFYSAAIVRDPAYVPAALGLARIYGRRNERTAAIEQYENVLRLDEGHDAARREIEELLESR